MVQSVAKDSRLGLRKSMTQRYQVKWVCLLTLQHRDCVLKLSDSTCKVNIGLVNRHGCVVHAVLKEPVPGPVVPVSIKKIPQGIHYLRPYGVTMSLRACAKVGYDINHAFMAIHIVPRQQLSRQKCPLFICSFTTMWLSRFNVHLFFSWKYNVLAHDFFNYITYNILRLICLIFFKELPQLTDPFWSKFAIHSSAMLLWNPAIFASMWSSSVRTRSDFLVPLQWSGEVDMYFNVYWSVRIYCLPKIFTDLLVRDTQIVKVWIRVHYHL